MPGAQTDAQIQVAQQKDLLQVRVIGRATFKISRPLREYFPKAFDQGVDTIIFDFSECRGMDSTFMGVLAMIGLEAQKRGSLVILVNTTEQHKDLLDGIGISKLFRFSEETTPEASWEKLCEAASEVVPQDADSDTMLQAHQTLMDVSEDNIPKFKDVVELLQSEKEQSSGN